MSESLMLREMFFNVIRVIGCICVIGAFVGFSIYYNRQMRHRLQLIRDLLQIMTLFKGEIEYQISALPEAFIRTGRQVEGKCGEWFQDMGEQLRNGSGMNFNTVWKSQLEILKKSTDLSSTDIARLERLGIQISNVDRNTQLRAIELYMDELMRQISMLDQETPVKVKLVATVSVLAAIFIIILLI